jgi:dGTPase
MKYPWGVDVARNKTKKFGFFQSEAAYAAEIANKIGLLPEKGGGWCRHPLAYVVEAADDICYSIIDLEDSIIIRSFDFHRFEELLKPFLKGDVDHSKEYEEVAKTDWQKISYLRSKAIGSLVKQCVQEFLNNEDKLLAGEYAGSLVDNVPGDAVVKTAKALGLREVFEHEKKQYAEIASFEILDGLLSEFTAAYLDVKKDEAKASLKSRRMQWEK